jgi:hypothetical protein
VRRLGSSKCILPPCDGGRPKHQAGGRSRLGLGKAASIVQGAATHHCWLVTKFPDDRVEERERGTGYAALQKLGTKGVYCATTFLLDMGSSSKNIWDDVPGTTSSTLLQ